jgi:hypothetical protein
MDFQLPAVPVALVAVAVLLSDALVWQPMHRPANWVSFKVCSVDALVANVQ